MIRRLALSLPEDNPVRVLLLRLSMPLGVRRQRAKRLTYSEGSRKGARTRHCRAMAALRPLKGEGH